jgi:hypothetical protein
MQNQVFDIPFQLATSDILRVNRIRLGILMVLLVFFFWLCHVFLVLIVAALLNVIIESAALCLFGGSAVAIMTGQFIKREFERWELERASRTSEQTVVGRFVFDSIGLQIVYDRTTTAYGWEDFSDVKNHGTDVQFLLRGGGDLFVPAHLLKDNAEFSRLASFAVENVHSRKLAVN